MRSCIFLRLHILRQRLASTGCIQSNNCVRYRLALRERPLSDISPVAWVMNAVTLALVSMRTILRTSMHLIDACIIPCIYVHIVIHTYIRICTYVHIRMLRRLFAFAYESAPAYGGICIWAYAHIHMHPSINAYAMYMCTCTIADNNMYACRSMHANPCTYA